MQCFGGRKHQWNFSFAWFVKCTSQFPIFWILAFWSFDTPKNTHKSRNDRNSEKSPKPPVFRNFEIWKNFSEELSMYLKCPQIGFGRFPTSADFGFCPRATIHHFHISAENHAYNAHRPKSSKNHEKSCCKVSGLKFIPKTQVSEIFMDFGDFWLFDKKPRVRGCLFLKILNSSKVFFQ